MTGKKKRPSARLSEPPARLLEAIEKLRADVQHHEENGQHDTAIHTKLRRLEAILAQFGGQYGSSD